MKKNLVFMVFCMICAIAALCAMMYFICHNESEESVLASLFFIVISGLGYFTYRVIKTVKDVKSHYEYIYNEDDAAYYLSLQSDTRLEFYFCSLPQKELLAERKKYLSRYDKLKSRYSSATWDVTEKLQNDCLRILVFIRKALERY